MSYLFFSVTEPASDGNVAPNAALSEGPAAGSWEITARALGQPSVGRTTKDANP
jgi:hypothetical protein